MYSLNAGKKTAGNDRRRGVTLVMAVLLFAVMLMAMAFAMDLGQILLVRTRLQVAADSAALAAASRQASESALFETADRHAGYREVAKTEVGPNHTDIELGTWNVQTRTFTPSRAMGNAVKVTVRTDDATSGNRPLFFAGIFNNLDFSRKASAVAMVNPRDIALVVDLSGSMNDDTEPAWATSVIDATFASEGYPNAGGRLMQQLFADFGYGDYPGTLEYLGQAWEVPQDKYAYAELTKDNGPLARNSVPEKYRVYHSDNELARKRKAYSAIIDYQIAKVMPNAKPIPDSSTNYDYWEKYLDYITESVTIKPPKASGSGGMPGTPPADRGRIPPQQDGDRIDEFNNPNRSAFPSVDSRLRSVDSKLRSVDSKLRGGFRNKIGYQTYVQFMVDHGRDLQPVAGQYVPLSTHSAHCPRHDEQTAGGKFNFPPRTQPMHAARRSLIAALQALKDRNSAISDPNRRDWVTIITFDGLSGGGPVVVQPLTADYDLAMQACTELQAAGDRAASTATEAGMLLARETLKSRDGGGQGRRSTNKVVVLLTNGTPDLYVSDSATVDQAIAESNRDDFYANGTYCYDAPLMQSMQMRLSNWQTFPVGMGLGADYDLMDRMARLGGTADHQGKSSRGSGNPAEYEQRLSEVFGKIITNPKVRLVQ